MEECFRCGATKDETRLLDAISSEGIVKACRECINRENLPLVKKPSLEQLKESEENLSVREKLSMMAGIEKRKDSNGKSEYIKTSEKTKENFDLNDIIERNLEKKKISQKNLEKLPPEKELVENFHWIVMRARRLKKISQKQLASDIGESETAINMVEKGDLPQDFEKLVKKLESYLKIKLFKNPQHRKESKAEISFDPYFTKNTSVEELKRNPDEERESEEESEPREKRKKKKELWSLFRKKARKAQNNPEDNEEETNFEEPDYEDLEDYNYKEYEHPKKDDQKQRRDFNQNNKDKKDKEDLSQKDIDELIFRK